MCLYATSSPEDGAPYLVHPLPAFTDAIESQYLYEFPQRNTPPSAPYLYPNKQYAKLGHPSDVRVGWDWVEDRPLFIDSMFTLGSGTSNNYSDVTIVKSTLTTEGLDYVALAAEGHQYAKGVCFWIRPCTSSELVGHKCSAVVDNTGLFDGFCFRSSTGSLECGSMSKLTNKFGENAIILDAPEAGRHANTNYACPHKAPVTTSGRHTVNRLLIAGCMITSDANYSYLADVHVPEMCNYPMDYKKGCMFPRATNYDMTAVQSGPCYYHTKGCTSSLAVNYNMEALEDDGTCITANKGCTLSGQYTGVASNTPSYQSDFIGLPLRSVGKYSWIPTSTQVDAVLNYDAGANVLQGCVLAVEGCMDSTALNFDSFANVNSNTWCIPIKKGCMMPPTGFPAVGYDPAIYNTIVGVSAFSRVHTRDGLAMNFDSSATMDSGCIIEREGCMDSLAFNYDPSATKPSFCWPNVPACLHPGALNFGCDSNFVTVNVSAFEAYPLSSTNCTVNGLVTLGSSHEAALCNFLPPSPPPPPVAISANTVFRIEASMTASNAIESFNPLASTTICNSFTSLIAALNPSECAVTAVAGSTNVAIRTRMDGEASQSSGISSLRNSMATAGAASGALGIDVLTTPQIIAIYENPSDDVWPIAVGATVGVVGGLLLLGVGLVLWKRKKSKVEA